MTIRVPTPNPALDAILTGKTGTLASILDAQAVKAKSLYQARVHKKTGRLAASAKSFVEERKVVKGQSRLVGVVTVGGTLPVSHWFSRKNPNPGKEFYYGVFHEFGNHYTAEVGGGGLTASQERRLDSLKRLAVDRAASPSEKALARGHIKRLMDKIGPSRIIRLGRKHPAAKDLEAVIREMAT